MRMILLALIVSFCPAAWADGWLSIGTGAVLIDSPDSPEEGDGGVRGTGNMALTFAGKAAIRARVTAFGYAGNSAVEQAVLVGARIGKQGDGILLVGYSKLDDLSETEDNSNGASVELLYAPRRRGVVSYEVSLHGNLNDDHAFGGVLIAGRFGSMGKQP